MRLPQAPSAKFPADSTAPSDIHERSAESAGVVVPELVSPAELAGLLLAVQDTSVDGAGTRRLIDAPWWQGFAQHLCESLQLRRVLSADLRAVQCTLFVKSTARNWLVSLHQDLSIPVAERVDCPGCSGWSEKEGDIFVQPPIEVLEQMVAVRLHLEHTDERDGALRVVPGSHRMGRLTSEAASCARRERGEVHVSVPRGGAMLMRPLLLHASSKTSMDTPRRVLHFVFGPHALPNGLKWPVLSGLVV
jgi:hypothetical protein